MSILSDIVARFSKPALIRQTSAFYQNDLPGQTLPHPSEALERYAGRDGIAYFRKVRQTIAFVSGIVKLRIDAALSLPHSILAGDPNDPESVATAAIIDQAIHAIPSFTAAMRRLMFCIPDGVAFAEIVWGAYEATVRTKVGTKTQAILTPVQILELATEQMGFDKDMGIVIDSARGPVKVNPLQVVVGRYGSANIWGQPEMDDILADCWKLDWIDRKGLETLDKQGMPLIQITVPESWDDMTVRARTGWAMKLYKNVIIIPMGDQFRIDQPKQSTLPTYVGDDQIKRITALQDSISVGFLGVSFSNSFARHSGNDQSAVKNEMRFEKTPGDAATYDEIVQRLIDLIYMVNFPSVPSSLRARAHTDSTPTVDVTQRLAAYTEGAALGFPLSRTQFGEDFGLSEADGVLDMFTPPAHTVPPVAPAGAITVMSADGTIHSFNSAEEMAAVFAA